MEIRPAKDEQNARAEKPCEKLMKAPFVCNGCKKVHYCRKERRIYVARKAQQEYKDLLSQARTCIILERKCSTKRINYFPKQ